MRRSTSAWFSGVRARNAASLSKSVTCAPSSDTFRGRRSPSRRRHLGATGLFARLPRWGGKGTPRSNCKSHGPACRSISRPNPCGLGTTNPVVGASVSTKNSGAELTDFAQGSNGTSFNYLLAVRNSFLCRSAMTFALSEAGIPGLDNKPKGSRYMTIGSGGVAGGGRGPPPAVTSPGLDSKQTPTLA